MRSISKKISSLSFSVKIIAVYVLTLLLVLSIISYQQIRISLDTVRSDSEHNLDMLTEQIASNFVSKHASVNSRIYSHMRAYAIPNLMYSHASIENSSAHALRLALSQSITANSEYDYVLLSMTNGTVVDQCDTPLSDEEETKIQTYAHELLRKRAHLDNILTEWVFDPDTGIYIIYDLYLTSPMHYAGRAIYHLRGDLFSFSQEDCDVGFVFCDKADKIIAFVGMDMDPSTRETLASFALENKTVREKGDYFVSVVDEGSWQTVGFMKMNIYHETRDNVVRICLRYGVLGLALGILLMMVLFHSLNSKLRSINKAMEAVAEGNFGYRADVVGNDDISQIASTFNYMTNRIKELLEAVIEKELEKKDVEFQLLEFKYRALETQIRPHFIYNALETINSMARLKGDKETIAVVQRIARYFRNITVSTTKQYILVQEEFNALQDYTEIYKFIHGDKLVVTFSARENARYALLPTMIIQPVVENALQHGLRGQDVISEIIVHAYISQQKLIITVKDSGYGLTEDKLYDLNHGKSDHKEHAGIGLENVRQRLAILYGDDASLTINNRPEGGAVVKVEIPLTYSEPETNEEDDWEIDHI